MASQPESVPIFSTSSTVFGHLWDSQDGQPIAAFIAIQPPSSGPLLNPLMAQIKKATYRCPLWNYLQSIISLWEQSHWLACWLASQPFNPLQITYFLWFQEAIKTRLEETLQAASWGLPAKEEDEGREVLPSEGEGDSLAHQSFEAALFGWSWVLKDSGESHSLSLRNGTINKLFW